MKKFHSVALVPAGCDIPPTPYQVLSSPADYDGASPCIVVKALHPDFYLILGSVSLIVSEQGGALSHLAIVAREQNVPVVRSPGIIAEIPKKGQLSLTGEYVEVAG